MGIFVIGALTLVLGGASSLLALVTMAAFIAKTIGVGKPVSWRKLFLMAALSMVFFFVFMVITTAPILHR